MPTPNSGYSATLPTDVLLDTGVLYIDGDTPFGVSKGGLSFDPGITRENLEFDGKFFPVAGLDRVVGGQPKITGTIIEVSATKLPILEPGSASATDGVTEAVTITPKGAGELYATGDYLVDVRVAYRRGGGGFAVVKFPVAYVETWKVAPSSNKAEAQIEIHARQAADAANTGVAPYVIILADAIADA